jgi:hypothetical protein
MFNRYVTSLTKDFPLGGRVYFSPRKDQNDKNFLFQVLSAYTIPELKND